MRVDQAPSAPLQAFKTSLFLTVKGDGEAGGAARRTQVRHRAGGRLRLVGRAQRHRRRCQALADVSVSEAIWSTTTRRRAASVPAVSQPGRKTGSRVAGAPASTA